jgi:hypothetical protein
VDANLLTVLMSAMTADPRARIPAAEEFFVRLRAAFGARPPAPATRPLPPTRPRLDSVTVELEAVKEKNGRPEPVPPPERTQVVGRYRVRLVEVNEVLELTRANPTIGELKLRFTLVIVNHAPPRLNIKGLNCFVSWADRASRPSPAIVAQQDGALDLISAHREHVGRISWSFGTSTHTGRLFVVDSQELVIPYTEATHAVVLHLGDDRELVAMCRRA